MVRTGLSVVMCCHNSVSRLKDSLLHLARQKNDTQQSRELILVDNGSTDGTAAFAKKEWTALGNPFPMMLVEQPQLGQAFARKSGVLASKFDYGVFCDDDNWLADNYLDQAFSLLSKNALTAAFGGDVLPVSEEVLPAWFYSHAGSFAVGSQDKEEGDVTSRGYVWGAGMACRFDLLRAFYQSDLPFLAAGRTGDRLTSGDDSEICLWFVSAGYRLHYTKRLTLRHFIPGYRLAHEYFERFILKPDSAGASDVFHVFSFLYRPRVTAKLKSESLSLAVIGKGLQSFLWLMRRPQVLIDALRTQKLVRQAVQRLDGAEF